MYLGRTFVFLFLFLLALNSNPLAQTNLTGNKAQGPAYYRAEIFDEDLIVGRLFVVHAGSFIQGSPIEEVCRYDVVEREAQFRHHITQNLAVMETEVTRQMWQDVREIHADFPVDPSDTSRSPTFSHPVQRVSWFETILFANYLSEINGLTPCYYTNETMNVPVDSSNYQHGDYYCNFNADGFRLPTEGEWEYFCRAGTITPFWIEESEYNTQTCAYASCNPGTLPNLEQAAIFCPNDGEGTAPAGSTLANPWGIKDVQGNVWEWCWDWYQPENPYGIAFDYRGPTAGSMRSQRGGGIDFLARHCRSASRSAAGPDFRGYWVGFRLVRTVELYMPTWKRLSPANSPSPRFGSLIAYNPTQKEAILYGGRVEQFDEFGLMDTWKWDGATWSKINTTSQPSERSSTAMAFHDGNQEVVLFGGYSGYGFGDTEYDDTWIFNGQDWFEITPTTIPPQRAHHGMAYDPIHDEIIMHGGLYGGAFGLKPRDDTWAWNGLDWYEIHSASTPPNSAAIYFDPEEGVIALYGNNEIWYLIDHEWVKQGEYQYPSEGSFARCFYPGSSNLLIFGGRYYSHQYNDTWIWDGFDLKKRFPFFRPEIRNAPAMFYDFHLNRVVLFGGWGVMEGKPLNDMWIWIDGKINAGDIYEDGYCDLSDYYSFYLSFIEQWGLTFDQIDIQSGDFNGNGKIDVTDLLIFRIMIENLDRSFRVNPSFCF